MTPQTFILFGASGSGKGTQAQLLNDLLKQKDPPTPVLYIETGEKFREYITSGEKSWTLDLTKKIIDGGGLLPDFLPVWMWSEFLIRNVTGNEHIILDGLSRRKDEAPILDSAMKFYKREKPNVILIEVSKKWSTERLMSRGRADDNEADISSRLAWYDENVLPAINYFKNDIYYNFITVRGEQSIEDVHKEILTKLQWQ